MHRISILRCNSGNIEHNKATIQEATNYLSSPAHGLWDLPRSGVHYKHFGVLKPLGSRKRATAEAPQTLGPAKGSEVDSGVEKQAKFLYMWWK